MRSKIAALILALLGGLLVTVVAAAPQAAQAVDNNLCAYGNAHAATISKYQQVGDTKSGSALHFFSYVEAALDLERYSGTASDWAVYVITDKKTLPQGNGDFPSGTFPKPASHDPDLTNGIGPLTTIGAGGSGVYTPTGAPGPSSIKAHIILTSDKATTGDLWTPIGAFSSSWGGALSPSGTKRVPLGVGIVRKSNFAPNNVFDVSSTGQLRFPSSSTNLTGYNGFVGVNDPSRCAFYFGTQVMSIAGTDIDTPAGPLDDSCGSSARMNKLSFQEQNEKVNLSSAPEWPEYNMRFLASVDYVYCTTDDFDFAQVKPRAVSYCWNFLPKGGNPTRDLFADVFKGVKFRAEIYDDDPADTTAVPELYIEAGPSSLQQDCGTVYLSHPRWLWLTDNPKWTGVSIVDRQPLVDDFVSIFMTEGSSAKRFSPDTDGTYHAWRVVNDPLRAALAKEQAKVRKHFAKHR